MLADPPKRRLAIRLDLGADDLATAANTLRSIAIDLDCADSEEVDRVSGGWSTGYHLTVTITDPEMTGDRFRELLEVWRQERVAERSEQVNTESPVS